MSNLTGHGRLTAQAVQELQTNCAGHPLLRGLGAAGLGVDVVMRDIIDVAIVGHWADFGQSPHFMRRFDGQSPRQAYDESVEWIRRNACSAANERSRRMESLFRESDRAVDVAVTAPVQQQCQSPDLHSTVTTNLLGMM